MAAIEEGQMRMDVGAVHLDATLHAVDWTIEPRIPGKYFQEKEAQYNQRDEEEAPRLPPRHPSHYRPLTPRATGAATPSLGATGLTADGGGPWADKKEGCW